MELNFLKIMLKYLKTYKVIIKKLDNIIINSYNISKYYFSINKLNHKNIR